MSRYATRLAAVGLALAAGLAGPARAHDGARLYVQRCAQCHSTERMGALVQRLGTDDAVRQRLAVLLPRHHAPDDADRDAIIQYVLTLRPAP